MEARLRRVVLRTAILICPALVPAGPSSATAAGYKTTNFTVSAPTSQLAKAIGDRAEACRRDQAIEWLGEELPPWLKPCPIHARVAVRGAGSHWCQATGEIAARCLFPALCLPAASWPRR